MEPDFDRIGDRIRQMMVRQGLTQRELARRSGFAPTQVSVILARLDTRPYAVELGTLARLAEGGGVSLLWLLTGITEVHARVPPKLADRAGWENALHEVVPYFPRTPAAIWEWIAGVRLPDRPEPTSPSPFLIQELMRLGMQLFPERPFTPPGLKAPPAAARRRRREALPSPARKQPRKPRG